MRPHGSKYWIAGYPKLVAEWHPTKNGEMFPDEIRYGSHQRIWWQCRQGHEWRQRACTRTMGHGCPYCANKRVSADNCLAVRYPAIARQWHRSKNGRLTPRDVVSRSARSVWWRCQRGPDHEWRTTVCARVRGARCPFCTHRRASKTNSLATSYPDIAAQWHPTRNGRRTAEQVLPGSDALVWWRCTEGRDHQWRTSPYHRIRGQGCPFCAGQRASATNSLAVLHPEISKQWHPTRNQGLRPADVTSGSRQSVWWKCPADRSHEWKATVHNRVRHETGCPFCTGSRVSTRNSVAVHAPDIARQWHKTRNGSLTALDVSIGSNRRVWWKCAVLPSHVWIATIKNRAIHGTGCPFCYRDRRRASV
jgi:hypothetical protein